MTQTSTDQKNLQSKRRQRTRGQGLVELALITPILVTMLILGADFGRAYTAHIAVTSAAREGASFGSRSEANATDSSAVQSAALADSPTIWGTTPTVSSSVGTDEYGYDYIDVTVNYTFNTLFPIPPVPASVNMSRTVRMRIIGN